MCNGGPQTRQIDHILPIFSTIGVNETQLAHLNCIQLLYILKRIGVLHNIKISFQPGYERCSCNVMETEYFANCTVFVSLAHIYI